MKHLYWIIGALVAMCIYLNLIYVQLPKTDPACKDNISLATKAANGPWYGVIYKCEE